MVFFFKQKTAYEMLRSLVGSEMCIRDSLWLALRHAQYPVDLITDKDVAAGRLQDYRVLFVVGAEMLAEAVEPLRQWVENGGTLYATAGGGLLDQYHRPNGALNEVYGILSNTLERPVRHIRPRNTLPKATPLDTVHIAASEGFPAVELPALLYRETFEPGAATVIGRYAADHAPAVLINRFGNGLSLIHISEPTRLLSISYAVFCLKKKNTLTPTPD